MKTPLSFVKRILCALLCPLLTTALFACAPAEPSEGSFQGTGESSLLQESDTERGTESETEAIDPLNPPAIAYIPLDNRPVNKERVEYLARSMGVDLLMPEEHLYRTALDNMEPNPDGSTLGNREALLAWVKETDKTCDYFIISLDQMLSGGLVGSRWLDNTDLTFEYEIADTIIDLCKNNTVYLFDTVMRLASTGSYGGYQLDEYYKLREYGQVARKPLSGSDLTVENIIAGYRFDANGKKVSTPLPESALEKYHASRTRKLVIADYILRNAGDDLEFIYVGVDDSSPQTTIQTNEIKYLTKLIGDRGVLSAAADELGMCCLARMATHLYGSLDVHLTYYGPGKNQAADEFDIGTLAGNVEKHLVCLDVKETQTQGEGLQVLILTRGSSQDDRDKIFSQLQKNLKENLPTVLLDVSGQASRLSYTLFEESSLPVGKLLGYSSWNTAGNAMGIALAQGVARYAYLTAVGTSTEESDAGFLQSMTFAYIKDVFYKAHGGSAETSGNAGRVCSVATILRRINQSPIVTSLAPYGESEHATVAVSNFRYPWNRTFEMTFDITVS
ncbi:MAG: DUF4127 family protein [Clostridia bacterium]|nr:DUF4127 family protein [Clostridia bacterium]